MTVSLLWTALMTAGTEVSGSPKAISSTWLGVDRMWTPSCCPASVAGTSSYPDKIPHSSTIQPQIIYCVSPPSCPSLVSSTSAMVTSAGHKISTYTDLGCIAHFTLRRLQSSPRPLRVFLTVIMSIKDAVVGLD